MKAFFVTGTDTDVGKTVVTTGLLWACRQKGLSTAALKPVASGCLATAQGLRNGDALALQAQCSVELAYARINPVALEPAIAPHLAARKAGMALSLTGLLPAAEDVLGCGAQRVFVEGAGGWRVPLNDHEYLSGLVVALRLPVILVVGLRLGCINHAILTAEGIRADGLLLAGWVANSLQVDDFELHNNTDALQQGIDAPCLGRIPFQPGLDSADVGRCLVVDALEAVDDWR